MRLLIQRILPLLGAFAGSLFGQSITTTSPLPNATVGNAYNQTFSTSGMTGTVTFSLDGASLPLPNGLSLTAQGVLSGTPTAAASPATFIIRATDSAAPNQNSVAKTFTLTIAQPLTILTTSPLPGATANTAYATAIGISGGVSPFSFQVITGSLGPLTLNPGNGVITGTPTVPATLTFTVQVTDSATPATQVSRQFTIAVNPAISISTNAALPAATQNAAYSTTLAATGGTLPLSWTLQSGTLPPNLTLASSTGIISGTPTTVNPNNSFTVLVTDAANATATRTFTLAVNGPSMTITTASPLPAGIQNVAYNTTLASTGGTGALTWSIVNGQGTLPTGLSITPSTGVISGTPTVTGTSTFRVQVADSGSNSTTKDFSLTVNASTLSISTNSPLPIGIQNTAYSTTLTPTGGTGIGYAWALQAGSTLPTNLTLGSGTGIISGTPTISGTFPFTVILTDSSTAQTTKPFSLTINQPLNISTTTPLTAGTQNAAYTTTLAGSGGTGTGYNWTVTVGSLPAGLSLAPSTGILSGTPTGTGTANFTVQLQDSSNATTTKAFALTINPAPPTITTNSPLPQATVNTPYNTTVAASGGTGTGYSFSIVSGSGSLPTGLSLTPGTGAISGTPTVLGTSNFTMQVTDSSNATGTKPFSLTVGSAAVITISTVSPLPTATVGTFFTTTLAATGGNGNYTWSLPSGSVLPGGLGLSSAGVLSGTPTASGGFNFTVQVNDTASGTTQKAFAMTVNASGGLSITTASLPNWTANRVYSQTLAGTGGTQPYTWTVSQGTLPTGVTLGPSTGALTGTPTVAGTYNFTIQLAASGSSPVTKPFTVVINAAPTISNATLPNGNVSAVYSSGVAVTGGTSPLTWAVTAGSLPSGLSLGGATGTVSGTPTAGGQSTFTVTVTDAAGATAVQQYTVTITSSLLVTTSTLPSAVLSTPYSATLAASGGTGTGYTWTITSGPLPTGITLATSGLLSGTPTVAGSFPITVQVTDSGSNIATRPLTLAVSSSGLTINTPTPLPQALLGSAYSVPLSASGGTSTGYSWTVVGGSLPGGLQLTSGGTLAGLPTSAGASAFIVEVRDSANTAAQKSFTLFVANAALTITNSSPLNEGIVGVAYSLILQATGGTGGPYTFTVASGVLPPGLTLSTAGVINGVPTNSGTSNFSILVSDNAGGSNTKAFSITVNSSTLSITSTTLPAALVNTPYTTTLTANGGRTPYTWSVIIGALPPGLTLDTSTGIISGTPTALGSFNFNVQVRDSNNLTVSTGLTITVASFSISTTSLPSGSIGQPYSFQLQVIGGVAPITYQLTQGGLPGGMTFSSGGLLSGTPTASVNTTLTFVARDANNATTPARAFQLVIGSNITVTTTSLPAGSIGTAYAANMAASGGTGTYTWGITNGALPVGLSLAGGTGQIRGTPSGPAGTYNFVIQATDTLNATAERPLSIVISALLSVSTTSLPNASPGVAYQQNLQAAGGTQPFTWTLVAGAGNLPQGLTLFNTGQLSGTTTQQGTFNFTVQVADVNGLTATRQLSLVVGNTSSLTVTTAALPNGAIGSNYSASLAASGGSGTGYTWSVVGGLLPSGLTLGAGTGLLSGIPSGPAGTSAITIQVADSAGATATRQFNLTINPSGQLTITTATVPSGVVGTAYPTTILQASGGSGTGYVWSLFSGSVPGLTLSQSGALAGTPNTAGTFPLVVQVRDSLNATATQNYSVTITGTNPLMIDTQSLASGSVGIAYAATLSASGGTGLGYIYSLAAGSSALPGGLTLTANGQITGIPVGAGTFPFTVRVTDSLQNTATRGLSIIISGSGPAITTTTLAQGSVGVAFSANLAASGGTLPYSWSVIQGLLPAGLTLTPSGVISGTPASAGSSDITFRVQDNSGAAATRQLTLTIIGSGLTITTTSLPQGLAGTFYNTTLAVSGGTGPFVWSVSQGLLPTGLTLTPASGVISGTPSISGSTDLVFRVQDNSTGATATRGLTISVAASILIGPATIANPVVGTLYSVQFTATGASGATTWSIPAGLLPAGLTLSATGVLSGTPTTAGNSSFTVRVQDGSGAAATQQYSVTVTGSSGPLTIVTTTLPAAAIGAAYAAQLQATGGTAPYLWTITQGVLPGGLGLIGTTGSVSGTPAAAETSLVTFQVRDSSNPPVTAQRQFTITIGGSGGGLSIVTTTLPNGTVGTFYSVTLQATGPTPTSTYSWSSEGTLPPGLGVSQAGALFGNPNTGGTYSFTIRVNESTGQTLARQFTMTIAGGTITISTTAVPNGALGALYNAPLAVTGGTSPYTWVLSAGTLPPGIGLTASTGVLAGTPTVPGNYNFTVQVTDASNTAATRPLSLTISAGVIVTTTSLAGGSVGQSYSQTLTAAGGSGTGYVWQLTTGALPAGLTLSSTTGIISGTPTVNGTSNFTIQVTDSLGAIATKPLSITVGSTGSLSIVTSNLPNAGVGVPYTQTLAAAGGTAPLQWSVVGTLPTGLTLNTAIGVISGTPTAGVVASFTVRVQDATGASATRQLTLLVGEGVIITTGTALPNAGEGVAYSQTLGAVGGQAPYTWSVSVGSLPLGLNLNSATGAIFGAPANSGNYSFIIQVTDAAQQSATKAFTLAVGGRVTIVNPTVLSSGTVRIPYSETLVASGGVAPYTWSLAPGGTLPLGITISPNGEVSGSPSSAGTFSFTAQVADSIGATSNKAFSLTVLLGLSVTTGASLPPATAGVAYVSTLAAVGGQAPYTWTLSAGNLPAGLTLNAQGILSGTPSAAGTFSFTALVSDSSRNSATASLSVVVRLPATPGVTINGIGETVEAAQQPRLSIALGTGFPVAVTGTLTLTFSSDATVPVDDPAVVFTNGRRTVDFTIPANTTTAQLPDGFAMQTGTVSGTLRLAVSLRVSGANGQDITPDPLPAVTARLNKGAPVIRSVRATRTSTGLSVELTGYATAREITQAVFRFTPAPGSALQTTELTIPLTEGARTWYQSDQSRPFGSQFTLTQQFNVQGDTSSITSVTVTLTNSQGTSQAGTANF